MFRLPYCYLFSLSPVFMSPAHPHPLHFLISYLFICSFAFLLCFTGAQSSNYRLHCFSGLLIFISIGLCKYGHCVFHFINLHPVPLRQSALNLACHFIQTGWPTSLAFSVAHSTPDFHYGVLKSGELRSLCLYVCTASTLTTDPSF